MSPKLIIMKENESEILHCFLNYGSSISMSLKYHWILASDSSSLKGGSCTKIEICSLL